MEPIEFQVTDYETCLQDDCQFNQDSLALYESECSTQSSMNAAEDSQPVIKANLMNRVKKSGRKPAYDTKLLSKFINKKIHKKASLKSPKKEYVRCKLIRNHKKMNRSIGAKSLPYKSMAEFNTDNAEACRLFKTLETIYMENKDVLELESQTESGPKTDGKSKRKANPSKTQGSSETHLSFNTEYIQHYFRNEATKRSFFYFVELVFSDPDPHILCEKFEFCCCKSETSQEHINKCCKKWEKLKSYVQIRMLEDLKIDAWKPDGFSASTKEEKQRKEIPITDIIDEENFYQFGENIEEIDIGGIEL